MNPPYAAVWVGLAIIGDCTIIIAVALSDPNNGGERAVVVLETVREQIRRHNVMAGSSKDPRL